MEKKKSVQAKKIVPVIVGPTGSGKTGVGIEIARTLGLYFSPTEIISADSRTIYKGMDIGTAKPSLEERGGVEHWGFDLVEPDERFTVADWKGYARGKIGEIEARGGTAMVVGGTGLYVDALIYDYQFSASVQKSCSDREKMCSKYKVFGIMWRPEELRARLTERASKMFTQELFEETIRLVENYGWDNQAMKSNIYQFAWGYMRGEYSLERAIELNVFDDWHLAKRQMTWFKRNKNITWLPLEKVKPAVIKCVQNEQGK